jgi:hypothetical protein
MVRWDGGMVQVVRHLMALKQGSPLARSVRVRNTVCQNIKCVNPDHYQAFEQGTLAWGEISRWTTLEYKQRLRDLWFAQTDDEREAWGAKKRFAEKHNINPSTVNLIINNAFVLYKLK